MRRMTTNKLTARNAALLAMCLCAVTAYAAVPAIKNTDFYYKGDGGTYRLSQLINGWQYNNSNDSQSYLYDDGTAPGSGNNVYLRGATFTISDGDNLEYEDFVVGQGWNLITVTDITGGKLTLSRYFDVGYWSDGHGYVNMSGGDVTASFFRMGVDYGGYNGGRYACKDAKFTLSGGTLRVAGWQGQRLSLGDVANTVVEFRQTGGTFVVEGSGSYAHIGTASGSNATFDMTGGEFTMHMGVNGTVVVGGVGTGTLNVSGKAVFSPMALVLGESAGGVGTVNLGEGGVISVDGNNSAGHNKGICGKHGSATFNFDGGTLRLESEGLKIDAAVSTTVSAKGGTIDTQGHAFTVNPGITGEGTLTLTGGGMVVFAAAPTCNIKVVNGTSVSFAAKPTGALTVERGIVKLTTDATPDVITLGTAGFIEYDLSSITEAGYVATPAENVTITTTDNSPVPEHVIIKNGGCGWNVTYSGTTLSATSFDATTTKAGAFTIFTGYYNDEYRTDQVQSWVNGLTTDGTATEKVIVSPNVKSMKLCGHVDCGDFIMSGDLTVACRVDAWDNRLFCKSISGDGTLTFYAKGRRFGYLGALYPTVAGINCDVNVPIVLSGDIFVRSASADSLLRFNKPVTIADKASILQDGSVDPVFNDDVTVNGSYNVKSILSVASGKTLSGCGTVTGNLAMDAGAKLAVTFDENGAVSPLTVTGNANLTGATVEFSGAENVADVASGTEIVLFKAGTITGWERTVVEIGGKKWRIRVKDTDNGQALVAIKGIPGLVISVR